MVFFTFFSKFIAEMLVVALNRVPGIDCARPVIVKTARKRKKTKQCLSIPRSNNLMPNYCKSQPCLLNTGQFFITRGSINITSSVLIIGLLTYDQGIMINNKMVKNCLPSAICHRNIYNENINKFNGDKTISCIVRKALQK